MSPGTRNRLSDTFPPSPALTDATIVAKRVTCPSIVRNQRGLMSATSVVDAGTTAADAAPSSVSDAMEWVIRNSIVDSPTTLQPASVVKHLVTSSLPALTSGGNIMMIL